MKKMALAFKGLDDKNRKEPEEVLDRIDRLKKKLKKYF